MTDSAPRKAPQASAKQASTRQASAKQAGTKQASTDQGNAEQASARQAAVKADADDVTATQAGAQEAHDDGKPDMDDVKRKFREALDRKRETHTEGSATGGRDSGKIHNAHGPARSRRDFRRKSG